MLGKDGKCHAPVLRYKGIRELEKSKIIHNFYLFFFFKKMTQ
jgi:hypothetical protein